MSCRRFSCCAVLLAIGLFLSSLVTQVPAQQPRQQPAPPKPAPRPATAPPAAANASQTAPAVICSCHPEGENKIRAALEQKTVLEFVETPLMDVIQYLEDYHKIPIQLDKKALDNSGLGTDTPITRQLRGIALRSALEIMLAPYELTWVIDNEVLMITTSKSAREMRKVCMYNVADLTGKGSVEELANVVRRGIGLVGDAESGQGSPDIALMPYQNLLIVRHSPLAQHEVEQFLQQLRTALAVSK